MEGRREVIVWGGVMGDWESINVEVSPFQEGGIGEGELFRELREGWLFDSQSIYPA